MGFGVLSAWRAPSIESLDVAAEFWLNTFIARFAKTSVAIAGVVGLAKEYSWLPR